MIYWIITKIIDRLDAGRARYYQRIADENRRAAGQWFAESLAAINSMSHEDCMHSE